MYYNFYFIFFDTVYCSGELAVISTPDSVVLKQTNVPLDCAAVGSMMSACAGNSIVESSNLKFAYITDPFNTAEITFLISLSGANKINYSPTKPMLFTVREDKCSDSLASTMERFEEDGSTVLDLDLSGGLQNVCIFSRNSSQTSNLIFLMIFDVITLVGTIRTHFGQTECEHR